MAGTKALIMLAGALFAAILVPFAVWGDQIETALGELLVMPGSTRFVAMIIFAALAMDVLLPLPSSLLSAAAFTSLGSFAGGIIVWTGMTAGHVGGYLIGARFGHIAVEKVAGAHAASRLRGMGASVRLASLVASTRAVPVFSEACTVVAGASRMPFTRFLAVAASANFGVALIYGLFIAFAGEQAPFLAIFAASIVIPAGAYGLMRLITARMAQTKRKPE